MAFSRFLKRNTTLIRKFFNNFKKIEIPVMHQKTDNIASRAATEAFPCATGGKNEKTGGFLAVKGTQPFQ
jgi:hypothetical protein